MITLSYEETMILMKAVVAMVLCGEGRKGDGMLHYIEQIVKNVYGAVTPENGAHSIMKMLAKRQEENKEYLSFETWFGGNGFCLTQTKMVYLGNLRFGITMGDGWTEEVMDGVLFTLMRNGVPCQYHKVEVSAAISRLVVKIEQHCSGDTVVEYADYIGANYAKEIPLLKAYAKTNSARFGDTMLVAVSDVLR